MKNWKSALQNWKIGWRLLKGLLMPLLALLRKRW